MHLGDGIRLFQTRGLDDYASKKELEESRAGDEKSDWRRVSHTDPVRCYSVPWFFDPQGFVFHVPAFLIAELNERDRYGFIDPLIRIEEHPVGWRRPLTEEQRRAIISMRKLVREHPCYEHERQRIGAAVQSLDDASDKR
jgi:hypothetical protein